MCEDINYRLISAVRDGNINRVQELIYSFGLSYSPAWSEGYVLLLDAIRNQNTEIAKILLTNGSKVNSKNKKPSDTPLHLAIINGDVEIVKMLLNAGANIHARNGRGSTVLHDAIIYNGKIEIIQLLLVNWAEVNVLDKLGLTPLHAASQRQCSEVVKILIEHGADINSRSYSTCERSLDNGYTPLHYATERNNEEIVKLLLKNNANVNIASVHGITPLHLASKRDKEEIVEVLLNKDADVNAKMNDKSTPLHFASEQGRREIVKLLLNKGADVNAKTTDELMPLHAAIKKGNKAVVKLILEHGADVDAQDKNGKTILHFAVEGGNSLIVEDVLKYFPDINNKSNKSSINTAVQGYGEEYKKIVQILLQHGFVVNLEDASNPKLLHNAIEKGYLKIVEDLLKYDADVNMLHISMSPLHTAVKNKQEEVTKLLIRYGANVNAKDDSKNTPIFYAITNIDSKITKLLLTNGADIKDNPELLNTAVKNKCREIVEILLQHGADVNITDKYGRTALHFTALNENISLPDKELDIHVRGEIAEILLSKGANINAETNKSKATLHIATSNGYEKVVEVLLKYGAEYDSRKREDVELFLYAVEKGYSKIVEIFLKFEQFGAKINRIRDKYGRTLLHVACNDGHIQTVNALLEYGANVNIKNNDNHTPLEHLIMLGNIICDLDTSDYYNSDCYNCYDYVKYSSRQILSSKYKLQEITKIIKQHILKIHAAGLYVRERNLQLIDFDDTTYNFLFRCKVEIEIMKNKKVDDSNVSFYDILTKSISQLAKYAKNENIVQALKSDNHKMKFPIYTSVINSRFRSGVVKKELLEQSNKISYSLFVNFHAIPRCCIEEIFSYLSNKDLRILIDACKPLNKS